MRHGIRTSTNSMTFVPKPLKFLRLHYKTLKAFYGAMLDSDLKVLIVLMLSGEGGEETKGQRSDLDPHVEQQPLPEQLTTNISEVKDPIWIHTWSNNPFPNS